MRPRAGNARAHAMRRWLETGPSNLRANKSFCYLDSCAKLRSCHPERSEGSAFLPDRGQLNRNVRHVECGASTPPLISNERHNMKTHSHCGGKCTTKSALTVVGFPLHKPGEKTHPDTI